MSSIIVAENYTNLTLFFSMLGGLKSVLTSIKQKRFYLNYNGESDEM